MLNLSELLSRFDQGAINQGARFGVDVLYMRILPTIHYLDHDDEYHAVLRIDPEPGAGRTSPVVSSFAAQRARLGDIRHHRDVDAKAHAGTGREGFVWLGPDI